MLAGLDARGLSAQGAPSVGADREARSQRAAGFADNGDAEIIDLDRGDVVVEAPQGRQRHRARFERSDKMTVLDIVTEDVEPDLFGRKAHFRGADEAPGVID